MYMMCLDVGCGIGIVYLYVVDQQFEVFECCLMMFFMIQFMCLFFENDIFGEVVKLMVFIFKSLVMNGVNQFQGMGFIFIFEVSFCFKNKGLGIMVNNDVVEVFSIRFSLVVGVVFMVFESGGFSVV